jgi:putative membrane protein
MSSLDDPRVFLAAERTLLAWNRTAIALMSFGFVVERFGLFVQLLGKIGGIVQRHFSFVIGAAFIALATGILFYSIIQYKRVLKTLKPSELPPDYNIFLGILTNAATGLLGACLTIYILHGFFCCFY